MFRDMRRGRQLLSREDTVDVMNRCTNGVLACLGDEGYPYAVPLSYVYFQDRIYFHSAKAGHKIDAITKNAKVSFAVIDEDTIVSKEYTTYFRSVLAFGKARIVEGAHMAEPGCAVKAAVAAGTLSASRFESYLKLQREIVYQGLDSHQLEQEKSTEYSAAKER